MAAVVRTGTPSLSTFLPPATCKVSGLLAGEALIAGDACYIRASDGRVMKSIGTAVAAGVIAVAAKVRGFAAETAASGEAVTLFHDVDFRYGTGLVPGADLFVSLTAGELGDAASASGTGAVGYVVDATRIHVWESRY
ncbi:MAG TPA: hypothetical protein VNM48_03885 [Chloroflexota bacterium]|nr:hypothetical protein [Chloroflexota bacterium]